MPETFTTSNPEWVCYEGGPDGVGFVIIPPGSHLEIVRKDVQWGADWVEVVVPVAETADVPVTTDFPVAVGRLGNEKPSTARLEPLSYPETVARMRELGITDLSWLAQFDPEASDDEDADLDDWDDEDPDLDD